MRSQCSYKNPCRIRHRPSPKEHYEARNHGSPESVEKYIEGNKMPLCWSDKLSLKSYELDIVWKSWLIMNMPYGVRWGPKVWQVKNLLRTINNPCLPLACHTQDHPIGLVYHVKPIIYKQVLWGRVFIWSFLEDGKFGDEFAINKRPSNYWK